MEKHTRLLELRLTQCTPRPELHRHQIEALEGLLEIARAGDDYLGRSGNLFALARAEWMDRHANAADLYRTIGNERLMRAAEINLRGGEDATDYAELAAAMTRSIVTASPLELAANTTESALAPLLVNLLEWATEASVSRRQTRAIVIKGLWRRFQEYDPGCSWERICEYPPYRDRLPFADAGLELVGNWLKEAVGTQLVQVELPEPPPYVPPPPAADIDYDRVPSAAEAAQGFHAMYDAIADDPALEETRAVYRRIFEVEARGGDANDFMCGLEEADLFCELARIRQIELARDGLEHCKDLSQPHLELHYNLLRDTIGRCTSRTEVEYEVARLEALTSVESAWNHIFLHYALRPVTAAMIYELNRSEEQRATVRNSYAAAQKIFGVSWSGLLDSSRVRQFFGEVLFTKGQRLIDQEKESRGVQAGEVGLGLLQQLRADALLHVTDYVAGQGHETVEQMQEHAQQLVNSQRFATPEQMRAHVTAMFAAAMDEDRDPGAPGEEQQLVYWRTRVSLQALAEVLSKPPRPC